MSRRVPEVSQNKKVIETRDQTMCPMCPTDIEKLRLNRGLVLLFKYIYKNFIGISLNEQKKNEQKKNEQKKNEQKKNEQKKNEQKKNEQKNKPFR